MPFDLTHINETGIEEEPFCQQPRKPSNDEVVSVIRKEFVALTGDHFSAVILNQLLYWTQRVRDFDLLLEEERCFNPDCNVPPRHGWIYKTANDLIDETLLGMSHPTMRKYLKYLIDRGWLDERPHPNDKWNKTTQYRVNLRKLQGDLIAIGCNLPLVYLKAFSSSLEGDHLKGSPPVPPPGNEENTNVKILQSNENSHPTFLHAPLEPAENPNVRILQSDVKNFHSNVSSLQSNVRNLHSYTYTENTTENTNREHTRNARAHEDKNDFSSKVLEIWNIHVNLKGSPSVYLTDERRRKILLLLPLYFDNDLVQWEIFCKRVASSSFLMGQGPRKWRVSLDWVLVEENLLKVLEGNFDDEFQNQKAEKLSEEAKAKEISTILASIEDPLWKEWCSQLDFCPTSRHSVSLNELKSIANARFLEVEDDRLVWIGSDDAQVLSKVEDLRLKLLPPIERTFPNIRMLRTRLDEMTVPPSQPSSSTIHQQEEKSR